MRVIPFIYDDEDDLNANTYLLIDNSSSCIVIDPSKDYDGIINYINKNNLSLKGILLTHGHIDHIRGIERLQKAFNVLIYIGFFEETMLSDVRNNCSLYMKEARTFDVQTSTLSDGMILHLLDEDIRCINVPFHTKDSFAYYLKDSNILFTGDFLFKGSVGRSDLPTAQPSKFASSLAKITILPDNTKIYPGHGPFTTLIDEKKTNPFVK